MIFLANVYLSIHCSRNPIWLVVHHSTSASNNKSNKSRINRCASYIKPNRTKLRVWIKLGVVDSQQGFEAKSSNDNAILPLPRTNMTLNRAPLPKKCYPMLLINRIDTRNSIKQIARRIASPTILNHLSSVTVNTLWILVCIYVFRLHICVMYMIEIYIYIFEC